MAQTGIKHRPSAKNGSGKISAEARRLLRATVRRCHGSERQAAKLLRLANHAQLGRMLRGEMGETPAMRAAVIRAKARAERAFLMERPSVPQVDVDRARKLLAEARWLIEVLENMLR